MTGPIRSYCLLVALAALVLAPAAGAQVDRSAGRELPTSVERLKLPEPLRATVDLGLLRRAADPDAGLVRVIVRLQGESLGERGVADAGQLNALEAEQLGFLDRCQDVVPSLRVLGRVRLVLNAVFIELDAAAVPAIALDPAVRRIVPVGDYDLFLSETVPSIGAADVQADGFDGTGVSVAVLDSGIDYLHADLGGSGNPADYAANDPDVIEPGTFPTAKVVGGFDFVGSLWVGGAGSPPLLPDPDPLDDGPGAGHGTHVGDIIGGQSGVAPGVDLYAVKVCSSISNLCSGVALIQGMEFAVDPDGDGDPSDHLDVVNLSLGSNYGQAFDDDLSAAVDAATALGVLTVASAGNGGDLPYIAGTPANARTAISVAQTHVPSAFLPFMEILAPPPGGTFEAVFQPWSAPLPGVVEGPVVYGDGAGGNLDGCLPFGTDLTGEIVFVDRGACNFTRKIINVEAAGGILGIIGLVAPGDPFPGGAGDPDPIGIPAFMISQAAGDFFRTGAGVVRFDPTVGIPLDQSVVSSSSRGPAFDDSGAKPEIGAPGASVSATAGTGTGTNAFSGTSGAAPMVSGSAALLLDAFPDLDPNEVKARLMNNGERDLLNDALVGTLAPISRIGGGEVRVDRALDAGVAAWSLGQSSGAISFGFSDVSHRKFDIAFVKVRNYGRRWSWFRVRNEFRFADDKDNGAVRLLFPPFVVVAPHRDQLVPVLLFVDGEDLRDNAMSSGADGNNADALTLNEYDGYLLFQPFYGHGKRPFHVAWHVLPRKAARVTAMPRVLRFNGDPQTTVSLRNRGVGTAQNDAYALIALSEDLPEGARGEGAPTPDLRAVGINTFPVPAGFCSGEPSFLWAFAIHTHERESHANAPTEMDVFLDTDQDGIPDFLVFTFDISLSTNFQGRSVVWAADLTTFLATAFFFTEHATNTANTVMFICGEQVGLTGTDLLATNVDLSVEAVDGYFGGPGDFVSGITVTPLGERFLGLPSGDIPGKGTGALDVLDFGPFPGNSPELGVLLLTNGDRGAGAHGGATPGTEAVILPLDGVSVP